MIGVLAASLQPCLLARTAVRAVSPASPLDATDDGHGFSFSPLPFESVDTVSGNLSLSFTDLALPGNAGSGLAVTRSYNSGEGRWRLGIAGVPLHVVYAGATGDLTNVDFIWPDGSRQHAEGAGTEIYTRAFGKFTPALHRLELPNGLRLTFGHDVPGVGRSVTDVRDAFDNSMELTWQSGTAVLQSVTQHLLGGYDRVVTFSGWDHDMASSMSYNGRTWGYSWSRVSATPDPLELLHAVTMPEGLSWTFTYVTDTAGGEKLASWTNPGGATVSYAWGAETFAAGDAVVVQGRTTGGTVPVGGWAFDWRDAGATLEIAGPANRMTFTAVTVNGEPRAGSRTVASLTGAVLETETLSYQAVPNPVDTTPVVQTRTLVRDGATYTTTYTYGSGDYADYGQPTTIVESGQATRTTSFTYRHNFTPYLRGRVASITTTVGGESASQSFVYSTASGFLQSITTAGGTTTFAENAHGNVSSITTADGAVTAMEYAWGVNSWTSLPSGTAIARNVSSDGTIALETSAGATVAMAYDALGRPVAITPPVGAPTTISYGGNTVTTTRGASVLVATLDGFGRTISTSLNPGLSQPTLQTATTFDAAGRATFQSASYDGTPEGTEVHYDALGRPRYVYRADGTHTETQYFAWGVRQFDAKNRATDYSYTGFGSSAGARLTSVTDAAGQWWHYTYNVFGSLTKVDAPDGPDRLWTYDAANRLTASVQPESGTTTYPLYDAAGRLTKKVDARGVSVLYAYDAMGRTTSVDVEGSTADDATFAYDARGNVTTVATAAGITAFQYDPGSRLTSQTSRFPNPALPAQPFVFTTEYAYDDRDNVTLVRYPTGREVLYDYDAADRLKRVRDSMSGVVRILADSITYDAAGAVTFQALGNGVWETRSLWAGSKRPKRLQVLGPSAGPRPAWLDLDYTYDAVGNVTDLVDVRLGVASSFSYDALDRLTGVGGPSGHTFTYDALGNRLTRADAAGTASYTYEAPTKRLLSVSAPDARSFQYDAVGNVVTEGPFSYTQTAFNLIRTVGVEAGGSSATIATYGYDALQQRIDRTDAGGRHLYVYQPGGQILAEYLVRADQAVLEREYVYQGGRLLASVTRVDPSQLSVSLTAPVDGASVPIDIYTLTLQLRAVPVVPAGMTVAKVEFYQGSLKVGEATAAPYQVPWSYQITPAGVPYTFRARVVTTSGHAAASSPVTITVTTAGGDHPALVGGGQR